MNCQLLKEKKGRLKSQSIIFMSISKETINMVRYSLVVCRNQQKKYLCIQERNKKWWIVGGSVEKGETYAQAALREAKEEAAIDL